MSPNVDATPDAIVYSDPNCPFCYATELRLQALGLLSRVHWRGVQHAPELPVPMAPADPLLAAELPAEVASIRSRAPEVPIAVPPGKPNTGPAIEHGAAALRADPAVGRELVRMLYAGLWREGADISSPEVLARIAGEAGLAGLEVTDADREAAAAWENEWRELGLGGVPLIVRADGRALYGLKSEREIAEFLDGAGG
ncbi:MAG: DsbA family protein [Solirubrobacteraceae bacterium]|nr:DsbA family protein [Solirubrobacteraceae bacterium]